MASINVTGANMGNALQQLLMCAEIVPGDAPSYQVCKAIYAYHPFGRKMVDAPIATAQSQKRRISIADAPEERVKKAFIDQWAADHADETIAQLGSIARIYGVGAIIVVIKDLAPDAELPLDKLADLSLSFNVLDPLNTAGFLVLSQDPNSLDYQKHTTVGANGTAYHRSRSIVLMNETPMYIEYSQSAFGFVGRSVYQRALFPLKSFINTMRADDMVARKVGLLIAKIKSVGSIVDAAIMRLQGFKRQILKEAETDNVLSIEPEEAIESLNLQNIDGAGTFARTNIIKNIATAAGEPAKMLENETMVGGFGEGTEDAKNIARFVEEIRKWLQPVYQFFDDIVMRRAWNEAFYETIQADFKEEYGKVSYKEAFFKWKNSFATEWPDLLEDPESEAKTEDVRQKAILGMLEALLPQLDPDNKATTIQWAVENAGENKLLFPVPLMLDYDALRSYTPPQPTVPDNEEPKPPKPEAE